MRFTPEKRYVSRWACKRCVKKKAKKKKVQERRKKLRGCSFLPKEFIIDQFEHRLMWLEEIVYEKHSSEGQGEGCRNKAAELAR